MELEKTAGGRDSGGKSGVYSSRHGRIEMHIR